jgi:hypothetical protein
MQMKNTKNRNRLFIIDSLVTRKANQAESPLALSDISSHFEINTIAKGKVVADAAFIREK